MLLTKAIALLRQIVQGVQSLLAQQTVARDVVFKRRDAEMGIAELARQINDEVARLSRRHLPNPVRDVTSTGFASVSNPRVNLENSARVNTSPRPPTRAARNLPAVTSRARNRRPRFA